MGDNPSKPSAMRHKRSLQDDMPVGTLYLSLSLAQTRVHRVAVCSSHTAPLVKNAGQDKNFASWEGGKAGKSPEGL